MLIETMKDKKIPIIVGGSIVLVACLTLAILFTSSLDISSADIEAEQTVDVSSHGILSIGLSKMIITTGMEQEAVPLKGIYLDDGIRVEMIGNDPFIKTTEEIIKYASEYGIEETENWLSNELSEYLGGKYNVMISVVSLEPLGLEITISKIKEVE